MAASSDSQFDSWLSDKLTKLNPDVDLEVFVSYIRGILEEESSDEEKGEAIEGFLAEITVSQVCGLEAVRKTWSRFQCLYLVNRQHKHSQFKKELFLVSF